LPHWARAGVDLKGRPNPDGPAFAFGWSKSSIAEAQDMALQRARAHAARLKVWHDGNEDFDENPEGYYVGDRPLREPIIEDFESEMGLEAAITRNSQGVYVLNTAQVMFIDIDLPEPARPRRTGGFFKRLFGKPTPAPQIVDDTLERVRAEVGRRPGLGLTLYRTRRGYRGLVTSHVFDPASEASRELLGALCNDPLYIRLCEVQGCYRARLSPKPWRVGLKNVPFSYFPPQTDPKRVAALAKWDAQYNRACADVSVCHLVAEVGARHMHPEVERWVALHDQWCCTARTTLA
jgi:hypothetical protein